MSKKSVPFRTSDYIYREQQEKSLILTLLMLFYCWNVTDSNQPDKKKLLYFIAKSKFCLPILNPLCIGNFPISTGTIALTLLCVSIHNSKLTGFEKKKPLVVEVTNTNCIINVTGNRLTLSKTKSSLDFRTGWDKIAKVECTTIYKLLDHLSSCMYDNQSMMVILIIDL